jgi:hypothetical protein
LHLLSLISTISVRAVIVEVKASSGRRAYDGAIAAGDICLRLAIGESLDGLLPLVRRQGRRATETHALGLGTGSDVGLPSHFASVLAIAAPRQAHRKH